jgi:ABC-type transport system involved in cytochrome bd biosynthesis fused ATPase/permease subunit
LASALFLLAVGAAVVVVARLVVDLDVTAPVKALLLLTPVAVSEAITPLVDAMRSLARARAAADRVDALLGLEPAVRDATRATPRDHRGHATGAPDIRLEAVTASWTGARTDAGPVDLHVAPGTHLALMGPNGAGKSTLLALLARHLDPSGGRCTWDGADVTAVPADAVRSRVAVVDDEPHVFATTLRHNLRLAAPDATDADLLEALDRAGLGRLLAGLPDGLDTRLGAGGRGVSGGERARLGVARALASTRPVILLDEPVAHLDPPTARSVVTDLLGTDHHDISRTIVMVTHRDEGLDRFDRVIRIDAAHR